MKVPGSSATIVSKLLNGKIAMAPRSGFSWVDIKDVSKAHIKCLVDKSLDSDVFVLS